MYNLTPFLYTFNNIVIVQLSGLGQKRAQLYTLMNNVNCTIVPRPVSTLYSQA